MIGFVHFFQNVIFYFFIINIIMGGNKKTKEELVILYNIIMNFLLNCDIQLVLFYGSLLGYYRDNNFINMDDDIDAIISRNDYYILLKYISENKDISINIGINNDSILQLFYNKMGPFDIYIFDYHNDDILIKWDGNLLFKKNDIFPLKKVLFNNFNIFIPNNTTDILLNIYGENWKIPQIKNVDYNWNDINNVRKL